MICCNKDLTEKFQEYECFSGYVVLDRRDVWGIGQKVAEDFTTKSWVGDCEVLYDSVEVWNTLEDANEYQRFIGYMPSRDHVVLEVICNGRDVLAACVSAFSRQDNGKMYDGIQVGLSSVEVTKTTRKRVLA